VAAKPSRGEVWYANLEPVAGHEQGRSRPCVVISDDLYNHGPAGLVAIVPITRTYRSIPLHVALDPPEGGVSSRSFIMCDQLRTISLARLGDRWGEVSTATLRQIEDRLHTFLSLK
jgi:mRNA interferase MazF